MAPCRLLVEEDSGVAVGPARLQRVTALGRLAVHLDLRFPEDEIAGVLEDHLQLCTLQLQHKGPVTLLLFPVIGDLRGVFRLIVQGDALQVGIRSGEVARVNHRVRRAILFVQQPDVGKVSAVDRGHIPVRLPHLLLPVQPVQQVHQAVGHHPVAPVGGVVNVVEVLPLGDHRLNALPGHKLGRHRLQQIHHGQLVAPADGGQPLFQVPVVGKDREEQDHRRPLGLIQNPAHQALVADAAGLVSLGVDGKLNDHQIRRHGAVPGDVPVISDQAQLGGGAPHAGLDVMQIFTRPRRVALPDGLKGLAGVAVLLDGHRPGSLGDGAAQKGQIHRLPCTDLTQQPLDPVVVAAGEEGAGNHLPIGSALKIHRLVRINVRGMVSVVQVELDGGGGQILHAGHLEEELAGDGVILLPVQLPQHHDLLHAVCLEAEGVAGAAALSPGAPEAEGELDLHIRTLGRHGDADAVHQRAETPGSGEQTEDLLICDAAHHFCEGHQAGVAEIDGMPAGSVVLRDSPHRLIQQNIEAFPPILRILWCDKLHLPSIPSRPCSSTLLFFYQILFLC